MNYVGELEDWFKFVDDKVEPPRRFVLISFDAAIDARSTTNWQFDIVADIGAEDETRIFQWHRLLKPTSSQN